MTGTAPAGAVPGPGRTAGPRREYALSVCLAAAGAVAVLLCVRQGWATVVMPAPAPLPAARVTLTGQDLVPVAAPLALVSLAGLAAVIAARGWPRRLAGCLLAACGAATASAAALSLGTGHLVAAARAAGAGLGGSAISGGTAGAVPGGVTAPLPGLAAAHVTLAGGWQPAAVAGAILVTAAGLLVAWRGGRWPAMPRRYDRPAGRAADGTPVDAGGTRAGAAGMWDALSSGKDPTDGPGSLR